MVRTTDFVPCAAKEGCLENVTANCAPGGVACFIRGREGNAKSGDRSRRLIHLEPDVLNPNHGLDRVVWLAADGQPLWTNDFLLNTDDEFPVRLERLPKVISDWWRTICRSCVAARSSAAPPIGNYFWQPV
jgi:hypothetical protein